MRLITTLIVLTWISALIANRAVAESIALKREGGVLVLPVQVNDRITLDFTIDSGAADVVIPADVFSTLSRTGTITSKDMMDSQVYELADGSRHEARRFRIRSLKIGNLELRNIVGSVAPAGGTLLLGQSFLSTLPNWSIDNRHGLLVIADAGSHGESQSSAPDSPNSGTLSSTSPPNSGLPQLGQRFVDELKKPKYAATRCMLAPILASDAMTVAVSVDRVFSSGDVMVAIGGERVDETAKTPVRDLLGKHGADESLPITIRRAGKELVVTTKCTDAKPFAHLLLEAAIAASKNDAATCADKMHAARQLRALGYAQMNLAYQCTRLAGRIPNAADQAHGYYELYREAILETAWSSDALGRVRGPILEAVDLLKKNNQALLADDLKQQYDQALAAKSQPSTAAVTQ